MTEGLAGIILAAGEGRRLRPLTALRPKPLCPVQGRPLLDHAMARITAQTGGGPDRVAVNAHHLGEQVLGHVGGDATCVVEPELLGTAGAVGNLLPWIDGRDVLLTNSDSFLGDRPDPLATLTTGPRDRVRLLVTRPAPDQRADFPDASGDVRGWRYIGACLLPWQYIRDLPAEPSGLYEVLWRELADRDLLDLVPFDGLAVDCGTPADYLYANLSGGQRSVIDPTAQVLGTVDRCVVWDGAVVEEHESLTGCIRAGDRQSPVTVIVESCWGSATMG